MLLEHPAIADAAVVGRGDPTYGQVPVAAIVLRPGHADPGDEALVALCRARLARFKVPIAFSGSTRSRGPTSGKLRRDELRATLERTQHVEQESPA